MLVLHGIRFGAFGMFPKFFFTQLATCTVVWIPMGEPLDETQQLSLFFSTVSWALGSLVPLSELK